MEDNFTEIAKAAKQASLEVADLSSDLKNAALSNIARAFEIHKQEIGISERYLRDL